MANKESALKKQIENLVVKVKKDGKTDELEKELDKAEKALGDLKNEGMSEDKIKELKDLLDAVK